MQTQTKFSLDLYGAGLRSMNDFTKTWLEHSARVQAMQMRLAMEFWSKLWLAALTPRAGRGERGGLWPT